MNSRLAQFLDPAAQRRSERLQLNDTFARKRVASSGVYVIIEEGGTAVKIGVADDVVKRLRSLQGGNSRKLSVHCFHRVEQAYLVEKAAHRLLRKNRLQSEWFAVTPEAAENTLFEAMAEVRK